MIRNPIRAGSLARKGIKLDGAGNEKAKDYLKVTGNATKVVVVGTLSEDGKTIAVKEIKPQAKKESQPRRRQIGNSPGRRPRGRRPAFTTGHPALHCQRAGGMEQRGR
jgi:hypothetical protein